MNSERIAVLDQAVELSEEQTLQLNSVVTSVGTLWKRFGTPHVEEKVTSLSAYNTLISQIEIKAQEKTADSYVCDTIDIAFENSPLMLPDPVVMEGREISLFKSYASTYCGGYDRCIYVHYLSSTASSLRGGVAMGGTYNIVQTTTTVPSGGFTPISISGCTAYFPREGNGTRALKEIACGEQILLTFRAYKIGGKYYWIIMNQSEAAAKFSQPEAALLLRSQRRVDGEESWTVKANGIVIPRTTASSAFTVTDSMGWVEYIASGTTSTSMTFPTYLPEGFMCHVQNNSQGAIRVLGCSVATGQSSVPPRSVCMLRRGSGNYVLIFYIASLDTAIRV